MQLGFALFFVIVVASSMVASVVIDNIGFLGAPVIRTNKWTVVALLVTVAGGCRREGELRLCVCFAAADEPALVVQRVPFPVVSGGHKQVPSSLLFSTMLSNVRCAVVLPGAILFAFDGIKRSNISNIGLLLLYILLATLPGAPLPGLQ